MFYLIFLVLLGAAGHVFAKIATFTLKSFADMFKNPYVFFAVFCYGLSFILWIMFLKNRTLSQTVPLNSLTYVAVALLSYFIFKERLNISQYIGILVIMLGVYMLER
ncbi:MULTISPECIES: EamA family transporter [Thermoanaerobacterium]|uniref:EamA domain-containing protein n=2 Tax=Thermoanaerobacterium TaxID=28895 RepID=W9EGA1_9THEO|nr:MULTISPECIES: EamA family transporter [Thermoanaerobacterium]AFK85906.1 protein of unknown function DUF6 transmembrane [Thermoanaerobacterium saccharolyticum JW/SL-YS485]ETO38754.1 hypothetical protein V518_1176 [Thermoanaerobacterium aotearoense SCUT27]